jgi:mannose-6-phosphate isomerase-like protein (cupin superfamily)
MATAFNESITFLRMIPDLEVTTEEVPWYQVASGVRYAVRLSSAKTNGAYAIVECVAPPGCSTPMHIHRNEDEHYVVLAGTYRIVIEDRLFHAPTGTSFTVPRRSRHSWRNMSNETGRLLAILTPGGLENCIQTIRNSREDEIPEVVERYGCVIVGQPLSR